MTERDDRYAEDRELVGAGWEPSDARRTVVWKSPANGYFYPHDLALRLVRKQASNDVPKRPWEG